jgi:hypothetical protein
LASSEALIIAIKGHLVPLTILALILDKPQEGFLPPK